MCSKQADVLPSPDQLRDWLENLENAVIHSDEASGVPSLDVHMTMSRQTPLHIHSAKVWKLTAPGSTIEASVQVNPATTVQIR